MGRNLITHKAMFLCFIPLVFLREVVVVLKHEPWMQINCLLSIFLDEQFNLSIHINFTYPLLLAKLYLQQHLFCLRRLSYFLSLFYCKFYSNFALRVKKKCGSLVTYKVSLQCRQCLILNLHRTW